MNVTFTTNNSSLQLSKVGSVALVTYATVGMVVISLGIANLGERAVVAYKRRLNRKINEK